MRMRNNDTGGVYPGKSDHYFNKDLNIDPKCAIESPVQVLGPSLWSIKP